ncbi:MAG: TonB-dependent receptor [Phenylobacterium sp.]|uniref:TonB-dependent receptor n=1 Tax=Phenylobacterium sp. TaxID=1871053 RepID=UPI001A4A8AF5|nr:TonB-dependent receptor [Phenylobacterium sp.]MBL8772067.1 TonB-dependent receptor [Phenylobacterium sp.]
MNRHVLSSRASLVALCCAIAAPAMAQTTSGAGDGIAVEELVVTARKREERLRDVPVAATALSFEDIRDQGGLANAQALLSNSPGVNFANTSNALTSDVSIRGSGTSRATNAEAGVGLFRNGAYIGGGNVAGRTFSGIDLFDIQRVEVLRGVQGGLGGRNASGGSINVVTARPEYEYGGYLLGTVGMHERREIEGAVNIPINEYFSTRLSVAYGKKPEGFYHLYVIDEYADATEREFFRGQLSFKNGPFTANLMLERANERVPGLVYQVVTFPNANFPLGNFSDKYDTPWNHPSQGKQRLSNLEFTTSTDLGWATLSTIVNLRDRHGQNQYDRDAFSREFYDALSAIPGRVSPAGLTAIRNADYNQGGDQIDHARISYYGAHILGETNGFDWLVGGEWYLLNDTTSNILGKSPTPASPNFGTITRGKLRFSSYAVYGSLGYDLTDQINLSGDLRFTNDNKDFLSRQFLFVTNTPVTTAALNPTASSNDNNVSYTATISYKPTSLMLFYAKIGSAYRAGGFNGNLGDPRQPIAPPPSFDNETVTGYEVGFKGNLAPNIYVTAAGYTNRFKNLVIQGDNGCRANNPACPVQATSFAFNAGPATLWGIEVEATMRAQLAGGALRVTVGGSRQGGHVRGGIYDGFKQPQQPKWTQTFTVNYRREIVDDVSGYINVNGNARQGGVQEANQTTLLHDYVLFNVRTGVTWRQYDLAAFVNNAGQENYLVFHAPSATGDVRRYNLPRTWGVQLRYEW